MQTLIEKKSETFAKSRCMYRSTPNLGLFPLKKTELTPIEKTHNPGILRPLISVSLQYGLRSGENDPLFDCKTPVVFA